MNNRLKRILFNLVYFGISVFSQPVFCSNIKLIELYFHPSISQGSGFQSIRGELSGQVSLLKLKDNKINFGVGLGLMSFQRRRYYEGKAYQVNDSGLGFSTNMALDYRWNSVTWRLKPQMIKSQSQSNVIFHEQNISIDSNQTIQIGTNYEVHLESIFALSSKLSGKVGLFGGQFENTKPSYAITGKQIQAEGPLMFREQVKNTSELQLSLKQYFGISFGFSI